MFDADRRTALIWIKRIRRFFIAGLASLAVASVNAAGIFPRDGQDRDRDAAKALADGSAEVVRTAATFRYFSVVEIFVCPRRSVGRHGHDQRPARVLHRAASPATAEEIAPQYSSIAPDRSIEPDADANGDNHGDAQLVREW